jgi:dTDP-4-dehydrorhamnose reductase
MAPRILITGGSGRLGTAIRKIVSCAAPPRSEMDITDLASCRGFLRAAKPHLIIHCAAFANATQAESRRDECWRVNVTGTRNLLESRGSARLVYISTDYVFDGEMGDYREEDIPNPVNFYGLSKLAGELITAEHDETLILRAPFRADPPWRFPAAFVDQWTSCEFVSKRAQQIVDLATAQNWPAGLMHIGGRRRSIYEMAKTASPLVGQVTRAQFKGVRLPADTSLNCDRWEQWMKEQQRSALAAV